MEQILAIKHSEFHPVGWSGKKKQIKNQKTTGSKIFLFLFLPPPPFFFFQGKIFHVNTVPSTTWERMSADVPFLTPMREQDTISILPFTRGLFVPTFFSIKNLED